MSRSGRKKYSMRIINEEERRREGERMKDSQEKKRKNKKKTTMKEGRSMKFILDDRIPDPKSSSHTKWKEETSGQEGKY